MGLLLVRVIRREKLLIPPNSRPLMLFGLACITSALLGKGEFSTHFGAVVTLVFSVGLFVAVCSIVDTEEKLKSSLVFFSHGALFAIGVSLAQMMFPDRLFFPGLIGAAGYLQREGALVNYRLGGVIGDYELFGEYLAIVGLIQIYLMLDENRRFHKIVWCFSLLATVGTLMLTSTRGALLVFVFGVLFFLNLRGHLNVSRLLKIIGLLLLAFLTMQPLFGLLREYVPSGYLLDRFLLARYDVPIVDIINRRSSWEHVLAHINLDEAIVFGHGMKFQVEDVGTYPHSLPLYLLYTVGIFGLFFFYWFILGLFLKMWNRWKQIRSTTMIPLLITVLVLFLIDQLKIEYVRQPNYGFVVWYLIGLSAATLSIYRGRQNNNEPACVSTGQWQT
ncbi:MAG: hypothetical protein FJ045_03390 [Crenarchaeota archaeon]|nr:hypothetical protein [Thermoproteota archaeon]